LLFEPLEPRIVLDGEFWLSALAVTGDGGAPFDKLEATFSNPVNNTALDADDVTLSGSGGDVHPAAVIKLSDDRFELDFGGQTGLEDYTLVIGPDIEDTGAQPMDQNRDGTPGDAYEAALFVTDVTIADGDATYDGQSLVVYGNTVTINGDHSFDIVDMYGGAAVVGDGETLNVTNLHVDGTSTLTIAGGATLAANDTIAVQGNSTILCQGKNTDGQVGGEWVGEGVMIDAQNVTVETGSVISADGQGYAGGMGPGEGSNKNYGGGGGSYGGVGLDDSGKAGVVYGSSIAPEAPGSGGGSGNTGSPGAGGGEIRLDVNGTLRLDGQVSARGEAGTGRGAGGSGGSIYVTAGTLAGTGTFVSQGGDGTGGGSGGGGRIAVYYGQNNGFTGFATSAAPGGFRDTAQAAEGTVGFFQVADMPNHLTDPDRHLFVYRLFRYEQEDTALTMAGITVGSSVATGAMLTVAGGSTIDLSDTLTVAGNSMIVCQGKNTAGQVGGEWVGEGVKINAQNVTVEAGSAISADGQGYAGGMGPGEGSNRNYGGGGGSYGGAGLDDAGAAGLVYGSSIAPDDLGSGGGSGNTGSPGAGGGAIRLDVNGTLRLDGQVSAKGEAGTGRGAGGSGGSIYVTAGTLTGTGTFVSQGGDGTDAGSGGGGRIAIYYGQNDGFTGFVTSTAPGGFRDTTQAGEGTVGFFQVADMPNHLTDPARVLTVYHLFRYPQEDQAVELGNLFLKAADGEGATLLVADGHSFVVHGDLALGASGATGASMTIGGGSTLDVGGTLTVAHNSTLLCGGRYTTAPVDRDWVGQGVEIIATDVVIEAGSALTADAQGYIGGTSANEGRGPGGGKLSGVYGGGGSHAGIGGLNGGPTYGAPFAPTDLGSGGAGEDDYWHGGTGGAGGGALEMTVSGTLTVDGTLSANGQDEQDEVKDWTGGGSGGSIYATAGAFTGSGRLEAGGGATAVGGGGGGGRILLHAGTIDGTATISANGGDAKYGGDGGEVWLSYWDSLTLPMGNLSVAGGVGTTQSGQDGATAVVDQAEVYWLEPDDALLHDVETVAWHVLGVDPFTCTTDVEAFGSHVTIGTGLPTSSNTDWGTTRVPDGPYEIRASVRDDASALLHESSLEVLVNNTATWHEGLIESDETWNADSVHIVEHDVTIGPGVRVTVAPGAIVKFAKGVGITVDDTGVLDVQGTAALPIVFTSLADDTAGGDTNLDGSQSMPIPGDWPGVAIVGTGHMLTNEHVEMRYLLIEHSGTLSASQVWNGTQVHHVTDDVIVPSGITLTINPGAVLKFDSLKGITVEPGGVLNAQGSLTRPITLTSIRDDSVAGDSNGDGSTTASAPGDWTCVFIDGADAIFDHVRFRYGAGPAGGDGAEIGTLRTRGDAIVSLSNSMIRDAFWGGVTVWDGGNVTVENTVITGTDRAVTSDAGFVSLTNCTLDDNWIGLWPHGGGDIQMVNSIISNSGDQGVSGFGSPQVRYSNIWSPSGDSYQEGIDGNVSVDPLYKDADRRNYRLDYVSPMIDAADGTLAPVIDLMGAPRYDDPRTTNTGIPDAGGEYADMGAYEFVETAESPIDMVVTSIIGPGSAVAGSNATLEWTLRNVGSEPIFGPWHDAVDIVRNPDTNPVAIEAAEVLVGQGVVLGPGESYTASAEIRVPGSIMADHRWQVRTNSRGEVFEGINWENNTGVSAATVALDLPELVVDGAPLARQFDESGQSHWFKFVPGAGEDVLVSLDLASGSGATELYVARDYMPTTQHFDACYSEWNSPNTTVLAPSTSTQTYYVLAHARSLPGATDFSIDAQALSFSVSSVDQTSVGDSGTVTIGIRGGELAEDLVYEIVDPLGTAYAATDVFLVNSSQVYATFEMTGLAHGLYDVQARMGGATETLVDVLEVGATTGGTIEYHLTAPDALRPGWTGPVMIEYVNSGNTDAVAPLMMITVDKATLGYLVPRTPDGDPVVHTVYERAFETGYMLGISRTGPAGILRPGGTGFIQYEMQSGLALGNMRVTLHSSTEPDTPTEWETLQDDFGLYFVPDDAWDPIFANFTDSVGDTMGEFNAVLADNATYLSRLGEYEHDGNRLIAFELEQCGLSDITRRYTLDAFGRGTGHPWNISIEKNGDTEAVVHYADGSVRVFYLPMPIPANPIVRYMSGPGDHGELVYTTGVSWTLTEADGTELVFKRDPENSDRSILDYVEDTNGNQVTVNYTGQRITSVTDSTGDSVTYTYNVGGRISQITDPVGRVTTFSYDPSGEHVLSVSDAVGTVGFTYVTGQGAAREHAIESIAYPDGSHSYFEYDERGRLTRTWADGGANEVTYDYDSAGSVTLTDSLGNAVVLMSDRFGALGKIVDPFGEAISFAYDRFRNLTSVTASLGVTASYEYDDSGNVTSAVDPLGGQTAFAYNDDGRLVELTDARGETTSYGYGVHHNMDTIGYTGGSVEQFRYDDRGKVIEWITARGDVVSYSYDAHDLLTRKEYDDGYYVDHAYDARRNMLSAADPNGTTSFEYDGADRVTRVTYPDGRHLDYAYDAAGRRVRMSDGNGYEVNYAYDSLGRLRQLTDGLGDPIVTYTYDSLGRIELVEMANGTYTTYDYDPADMIQHLVNYGADDSVISRFDYTYDDLGRRVGMATLEGDWTYTYDASGQLVGVEAPDGRTIEYEYDAVGNRVSVTDNGTTTEYTTNSMNQYTAVDGTTYEYDADGNLVSKTDGESTWTHEYDADGDLIGMTTPEGTWTYEYDALGNRIAVTHDGQRTEYLIDPFGFGNVVAEYDNADALVATYTHGLGLASRDGVSTGPAYYSFDASANTIGMTDATGTLVNSYAYLPFGEQVDAIETVTNPFTFVGQFGVIDGDAAQYFMRNRWYDPSLGRFTQQDPIGLAGNDTNLYRYVLNSPVQNTDPLGLFYLGPSPVLPHGPLPLIPKPLPSVPMRPWEIPPGRVNPFGWNQYWGWEHYRFPEYLRTPKPPVPFCQEPPLSPPKPPPFIQFGGWNAPVTIGTGGSASGATVAGGVTGGIVVGGIVGYYTHQYLESNPDATEYYTGLSLHHLIYNPDWVNAFDTAMDFYFNTHQGQDVLNVSGRDPNDVLGPAGYGEEGYVADGTVLAYMVRCENDPEATAPAQVVTITQQLDADLDWSTFQFTGYGFGGHAATIPTGLQSFSQRVDRRDDLGLYVDVDALLDPETGLVTWEFRSIDPVTGELTRDPIAGFLPPNVTPPEGDAYVTYTVDQQPGLPTGTESTAQASIVFDTNDAISTNTHTNTIDAGVPTSQVDSLLPQYYTAIPVTWSGQDDTGGSGIAWYDIYVSSDGAAPELWLARTTATSAAYTGEAGHTYAFYSVAADNVGHREAAPPTPDAETMVVVNPWHNYSNRHDVNGKDGVTTLDVLALIAYINSHPGQTALPDESVNPPPPYYDVTDDDLCTTMDVLTVIQYINNNPPGSGENGLVQSASPVGQAPPDESPALLQSLAQWRGQETAPEPGAWLCAGSASVRPHTGEASGTQATAASVRHSLTYRELDRPWVPTVDPVETTDVRSLDATFAEMESILPDLAEEIKAAWMKR